jgi:hypothetical protein
MKVLRYERSLYQKESFHNSAAEAFASSV